MAADIHTLEEELDAVRKGGGALKLARAFVALHRIKETLDAINGTDGGLLPGIVSRFKNVEVPASLEDEGVTSIPLVEGFRIGVSTKVRASVKADRKTDAYDWLRSNGLGSLVIETVNSRTLSAAAKSLLEDQNVELPDDLFSKDEIRTASVTSTK